jgi:acetyl-CoA carboxylase biotin carboxyl carrier protein
MSDKHDIDEDLVRRLADLLDEVGLTEIEYGEADWHIRVAKGARAGAAAVPAVVTSSAAGSAFAGADDIANHPGLVKSPMVGVVYLSEKPTEPALVNIGDKVKEGQTVLLIEAMKVFNPIQAPRSGTVTQVFATNEAPVEFGEPLLIIE